jgi:hypothetical protein
MLNRQIGPQHALDALASVVADITYKDGWTFWLADFARESEQLTGSQGLTLCIRATVPNSVRPGTYIPIEHWMAVPPASWDRPTWERWVMEQVFLVERHEAMEFFAVAGQKVFFPSHGPGKDPYATERR